MQDTINSINGGSRNNCIKLYTEITTRNCGKSYGVKCLYSSSNRGFRS